MSAFHMWMAGYHHLKNNSHQNFFIKKVLSLMFYKIDFGVLKFKNLIRKPNSID
jgi:hypothetical protein